MSAKAKQKTIADLIQQFADNQDNGSITGICDKIIAEVASIPTPEHFNFLRTATLGSLRQEFAKFADAKSATEPTTQDKWNLHDAKTQLGYIMTLMIIPLIKESYPVGS